jgi:hypothetical protein
MTRKSIKYGPDLMTKSNQEAVSHLDTPGRAHYCRAVDIVRSRDMAD